MVHDAGPATGRLERLHRRFPDTQAVVFGHSHIPLHESRRGLPDLQPRVADRQRRQPKHTMGLAQINDGTLTFELIALD